MAIWVAILGFNRSEAAIRSVTKAAGLRLNRHSGNSYAVRRYRSITLEIPEVLFASLVVAAARRNVPTDQLAVGILGGVLCAGNVERTLGRGGGYSFMRFRTSPARCAAPHQRAPGNSPRAKQISLR